MQITKLRDALTELRAERKAVDEAIEAIERVISSANGHQNTSGNGSKNTVTTGTGYVDFGVRALSNTGKPLYIKDLAFHIGKLKGKEAERKSVEATLHRHIKSAKSHARIVKVGPGYYALPEWPQETKDLWSKAVASN